MHVGEAALEDASPMARAAAILHQATKADQENRYADASQHYKVGVEYLLQVIKKLPQGNPKRLKLQERVKSYIRRAEELFQQKTKATDNFVGPDARGNVEHPVDVDTAIASVPSPDIPVLHHPPPAPPYVDPPSYHPSHVQPGSQGPTPACYAPPPPYQHPHSPQPSSEEEKEDDEPPLWEETSPLQSNLQPPPPPFPASLEQYPLQYPAPTVPCIQPTEEPPPPPQTVDKIPAAPVPRDSTSQLAHMQPEAQLPPAVAVSDTIVMNIVVRPLGGDQFIVQIAANATIGFLKHTIQLQQGFPVPHQRLIFNGKQLASDSTVDACGFQPDDAVHLVLRNPRVRKQPPQLPEQTKPSNVHNGTPQVSVYSSTPIAGPDLDPISVHEAPQIVPSPAVAGDALLCGVPESPSQNFPPSATMSTHEDLHARFTRMKCGNGNVRPCSSFLENELEQQEVDNLEAELFGDDDDDNGKDWISKPPHQKNVLL